MSDTRLLPPNPALLTVHSTRKLPRGWLFLLLMAYAFSGLIGRDPWRPDDAIGFGIAWSMAQGNFSDWLMPNVAAMPTPEEGPLPFWFAALAIKVFASLFEAPFAARIPVGLAIMFSVACIWYATYILGRTARAQPVQFMFGGAPHPRDYGRAIADGAALTLMATIGLLLRLHELSAEAFQFAWLCLLLLGLARSIEVPRIGALLSGIALAALCLTRGWQAALPGVLTVAGLLIWHPPLAAARRSFVFIALPLALVPCFFWAVALHMHGSEGTQFLAAWWHWNIANNQGLLGSGDLLYFPRNLLIFGWPALPFALIAAWRWRSRLEASHIQIPLALLTAYLLALLPASEMQEGLMSFLLPGATVLAAFLLPTLSRSAINAIDWFALMGLSIAILLIWLGWIAMVGGWPPTIANNFMKLAPGFKPSFSSVAFIVAIISTSFWLVVCYWRVRYKPQVVWRAMVISCSGLVAAWVLLTTLWMPWLNHTKTYRDVAQQIRSAAKDADCVSAQRLGRPQRAAFAYFGGINFERLSVASVFAHTHRAGREMTELADEKVACQWLLTQDSLRGISDSLTYPVLPEGKWALVWQGRRFSDKDERFRLYRRVH